MLANNVQNAAANVVVQYVQISYGPWARERPRAAWRCRPTSTPTPAAPPSSTATATPSRGTWHRSTLGSPTQFVNAFGVPIPLQPGQTWVELVPNTIIATTTP